MQQVLQGSGLQHRFISPKEVEYGELRDRDYRILMLPRAIALSSREAKQISDFVEYGGTSWPMASRGYSTSVVGKWPSRCSRPCNERGNELFLWQRKGDLYATKEAVRAVALSAISWKPQVCGPAFPSSRPMARR
jgi:hypothetical protein